MIPIMVGNKPFYSYSNLTYQPTKTNVKVLIGGGQLIIELRYDIALAK
jgi:hypothetical protein